MRTEGTDADARSGTTHVNHALSRPRRRGTALEDAILDAAWQELSAVGYANLSMAAVAARAKTSKAVLYRRWPNRASLAVAAVQRRVPNLAPDPPDTGNLRDDVLALLHRLSQRYQELRLFSGQYDELTSHLRQHTTDEITGQLDLLLRRARARGEIPPADLNVRIAHLPIALINYELFLARATVSATTITEIVDEIFLPVLAAQNRTHPAR